MSITIHSQPQAVVPVYNPFYVVGTSSNINQPHFNFLIDIFTGQTGGYSYATRIVIPPDPFGNLIFSANRVLENYLSYDLPQNTVTWALNQNCAACYNIKIGEQYAINPATGATNYSGLTNVEGIVWNGALQYQYLPNYDYVSYLLTGSTTGSSANFLSYQPDNILIRPNERASLSAIVNPKIVPCDEADTMFITVYQNSGGTRTYEVFNIPYSSTTSVSAFIVEHFGSGLWNLAQLNSGNTYAFSGAPFPVINLSTDYMYALQVVGTFCDGGRRYISKLQFYTIDNSCGKYETVRLMWINSLGGADYFTFTLVDRISYSNTRSTYQKVLPYNYSLGQRGNTVLDSDIQQSRQVNSNWVDDETATWLNTEMKNSPEVYELQPDGSLYPIILTDTTWEVGQYINNQELVQVNVNYNYAYKNVVQRG